MTENWGTSLAAPELAISPGPEDGGAAKDSPDIIDTSGSDSGGNGPSENQFSAQAEFQVQERKLKYLP